MTGRKDWSTVPYPDLVQVGICPRASGTSGAVHPGFPAGYHAEAPCRPPSLWEWDTVSVVEGLGVKLLTAVGGGAGLTGLGSQPDSGVLGCLSLLAWLGGREDE